MKRLLLFAGTTEGRRLAEELSKDWEVTASVATAYGAQLLPSQVRVLTGRLDEPQIEALLRQENFDVLVDATHPYAKAVTRNLQTAAANAAVPYLRLARPQSPLPADARVLETAEKAAAALAETEGPVFLTTGVKELSAFAPLARERLYVRVLPTHEALCICEREKIPPSHIVAMQGPFSEALNRALLSQFQIRHLVTKEGGAAGGFAEKVSAAKACGAVLWVLRRPAEQGLSYAQLLERLRALSRSQLQIPMTGRNPSCKLH